MGYAYDAPGASGMKKKGGHSSNGLEGGKMNYPSVDGLKDDDKNASALNSGSNRGRKAVRYASSRKHELSYTGSHQAPVSSSRVKE